MIINVSLAIAAALSGLFAVFLFSIRAAPQTPRRILAVLFALIAIQFVLGMVQMDGGATLVAARPVLAMIMAPLLYLHLTTAARPDAALKWRDGIHGLGPLAMLLVGPTVGGRAIDILGLSGVSLYLGLIAFAGGGPDRFAARGPQAAQSLTRWRRVIIGLLGAMLIADSGIMLDMARRHDLAQSPALMAAAVVACLALSVGLVSILHRAAPVVWLFEQTRRREPGLEDVYARLQMHMERRRPWTEPDLSVARLGRQTGLPQRAVSAAINQLAGRSFSRWVNDYRIEAAKALMSERPDMVLLEVMLDVGFQTKSNFNRAFREATGMTPSDWRRASSGGAESPN